MTSSTSSTPSTPLPTWVPSDLTLEGAQALAYLFSAYAEKKAWQALVERAGSVSAAIDEAFAKLSARDRLLVTRWASNPELTQAQLGEEFDLSDRTVRLILRHARIINTNTYERIERYRQEQLHARP